MAELSISPQVAAAASRPVATPPAGGAATTTATPSHTTTASSLVSPANIAYATTPRSEVHLVAKLSPQELQARLDEALQALNQTMANAGRKLAFSVDQSTHGSVVRVMDEKSGDVIRQIPVQVVLDIAHSIDALKGTLFSAKS
jgi:flagellar protein FlaG